MATIDEGSALQALVADAMFRALDEKKRDELVKSALAALVTARAINVRPSDNEPAPGRIPCGDR